MSATLTSITPQEDSGTDCAGCHTCSSRSSAIAASSCPPCFHLLRSRNQPTISGLPSHINSIGQPKPNRPFTSRATALLISFSDNENEFSLSPHFSRNDAPIDLRTRQAGSSSAATCV